MEAVMEEFPSSIIRHLLKEIEHCRVAGDFIDTMTGRKIEEGEEFIGVMNSYEKACLTIAKKIEKRRQFLAGDASGVYEGLYCMTLHAIEFAMESIIHRYALETSQKFSKIFLGEDFQIFGSPKTVH